MKEYNSLILILITLVLIFLFYFSLSKLSKTNKSDTPIEIDIDTTKSTEITPYQHYELPNNLKRIYNNDDKDKKVLINWKEGQKNKYIKHDSPSIKFINDSFDKQVKEFKNHKRQ